MCHILTIVYLLADCLSYEATFISFLGYILYIYIYIYIYVYVIYVIYKLYKGSKCIPQKYDLSPKSEEACHSGLGFISGKLPMTLDSGHIFVEYTLVAVVDMIYGDVTLGRRAGYVTMKTIYNYGWYLFVDSSI